MLFLQFLPQSFSSAWIARLVLNLIVTDNSDICIGIIQRNYRADKGRIIGIDDIGRNTAQVRG